MITFESYIPPLSVDRLGKLSPAIMLRASIALVAFGLLLVPALAEPIRLRGDITAERDTLILGDLIEGAPPALAIKPVFRAPRLGETGTIQTRRIVEAARGLGLDAVESGGRAAITVTRAARRFGTAEIETAVKRSLERLHQLDTRGISIVFDTAPLSFAVAPDLEGSLIAEDLSYDPRSRRISALMSLGTERRASLKVAGALVETVETPILTRALNRDEIVQAGDIAIERRPRETIPADALTDSTALQGRIAKRILAAGSLLRSGDLVKPVVIARGDIVTIVYEAPGLSLSMRGRANENGGQGDSISVLNPQSKRILQATILGAGKVAVNAGAPSRVASNTEARP